MANTNCKKCLHYEHDKEQARKHFIELSNEINRLKAQLAKSGDTIDIENSYKPTLRPIRVEMGMMTKAQAFNLAGTFFIAGFFIGAFITWGGFNG